MSKWRINENLIQLSKDIINKIFVETLATHCTHVNASAQATLPPPILAIQIFERQLVKYVMPICSKISPDSRRRDLTSHECVDGDRRENQGERRWKTDTWDTVGVLHTSLNLGPCTQPDVLHRHSLDSCISARIVQKNIFSPDPKGWLHARDIGLPVARAPYVRSPKPKTPNGARPTCRTLSRPLLCKRNGEISV
jgi:hypothetical protein